MDRKNDPDYWKNIRTDLLLQQVQEAGGIESFNRMVENEDSPAPPAEEAPEMVVLLNQLMVRGKLNPSRLAQRTGLSCSYVYELLKLKTAGKKRKEPSRDVLIRLAVAAGANLEELNRILKSASYKELYIKDDRDRYIWEGLSKNMTTEEIDDFLRHLQFRGLEV